MLRGRISLTCSQFFRAGVVARGKAEVALATVVVVPERWVADGAAAAVRSSSAAN